MQEIEKIEISSIHAKKFMDSS